MYSSTLWDRRYFLGTALIWLLPMAIVAGMVMADPSKHTVTPVYHRAVQAWWAGKSLYLHDSYFYFPHFAILYTLFDLLPIRLGDTLWRLLSLALFAWGTWRLMGLRKWPDPDKALLFCSLFALFPALGALHNGQANLPFAAVLTHLAVFLARGRWTAASLCLVALLILKPIGIVPLLLAPFVYRQLLRTLPPLLILFLLFPFFFGGAEYVLLEYREMFDRLLGVSITRTHMFADINGLLRTLGIHISGGASQIVRVTAGIATLGLWIAGARGRSEPQRALLLLALSSIYLMLFNPMTEVNSYAIVAPAMAFFAVYYFQVEERTSLAWCLVFADLSIALFPEFFRRLDRDFGLWWDPLMMLGLGALLSFGIIKNRVFADDAPRLEKSPSN